jgi:flavodoxin
MERNINILVIYDSQFGNTERIAQVIAEALSGYGQVRAVHASHIQPIELQGVDLMILGCPTQKWGPTSALRSFLENIPFEALKDLAVAVFDTRFQQPRWMVGSAAYRITRLLGRQGRALLVPPESFFVKDMQGPLEEGELERAAEWARMVGEKAKLPQLAGN